MSFLRLKDGSVWPDPNTGALEWKLRYTKTPLTPGERMLIASVMSAYRGLTVGFTQRDAAKKMSMIRKAEEVT